jgi:hypothetical protein
VIFLSLCSSAHHKLSLQDDGFNSLPAILLCGFLPLHDVVDLNLTQIDRQSNVERVLTVCPCIQQQRQELEELRDRSTGEACVVHAQGVMETARSQAKAQDSLQKGVAAISLKGKPTSTEVNSQMTMLLIITWF